VIKKSAGTIVYRTTVVERRTVWFDGKHSRTEEINLDYGVRSLAIRIRSIDSVLYCKSLRAVRFCVEEPIDRPSRVAPPYFKPLDETAVIAGIHCRKAKYVGSKQLEIWYAEEIEIDDPTGGVLQLEGVPGWILRTDDGTLRVTVEEFSFDPPDPVRFLPPAGYRRVASVDAARAEDQRLHEIT
jgi:hypothetical protein